MYRKSKKVLAWALVVCMVLTQMLFTNLAFAATDASKVSVPRLAGADRYQTAIEVSKATYVSTDYAVLAYGEDFADALAAAPLAKKYDAPILLTAKDSLSAGVLDELKRLGVKNVFIVGGEGVVSKAVADALTAASITPERLSGADRYATALAVANKIGTTTEVVVAYGENYADALSISAIAAAKGMPILLTDKDAMNADVKAYIGTKKAYVVGGEGVVGAAVFNGLTGAVRLGGADRYETNLKVLQQFADSLKYDYVFAATGEGFADALAGSVLAAEYSAPVVLVGASVNSAMSTFLAGKMPTTATVVAFGGAAVVSDAAVASVKGTTTTPATFGVESITSLGLNGVKVVFTQEMDSTSAQNVANYTLDGVKLTEDDSVMLDSDNKTLYIYKNTPFAQYTKTLFSIKDKVLYSKDLLSILPKTEKELTFSDVATPGVQSVTVTGNKKLTVRFNEPVKMPNTVNGTELQLNGASTLFKVDGQYVSSYGFTKAVVTTSTSGHGYAPEVKYATKVSLYFDVAIPAGNHTLTVLKGSSTNFGDAADYRIPDTDTNFTVETVTGAPQVVSVTGETNGVVYVTYDRAMSSDATTAGNYAMNANYGTNLPTGAEFKSGSGDKIVKLTFAGGLIKEGANILTVDNAVKDAWGNKLNDTTDQRYSFTSSKDTTKPTVSSVVVVDATHIRVKFAEPVDTTYGQKTSNYELKDSAGVPISITNAARNGGSNTSADTFDLTTASNITGSNYTLLIKNIVDMASPVNVMDDYTATLNGNDTIAPQVSQVVWVNDTGSKVAVYFNEEMDPATLTDPANYAYLDNKGQTGTTTETHALPSSASVTAGESNKSAVITFPSGYTVTPTTFVSASGSGTDYFVRQIRVSNVKDVAGNVLKDISSINDIVLASGATSGKPTFTTETFKLYRESDTKVRAEFNMSQNLSSLVIADFGIRGYKSGLGATVAPTSGYVSGSKVVLYFDNAASAGVATYVMSLGTTATVSAVGNNSTNANGVKIDQTNFVGVDLYDDQIRPIWTATTNTWFNGGDISNTIATKLTFSEDIDASIYGEYSNDFVFTDMDGNVQLSVDKVAVSGNSVYYTFKSAITTATTINVKAKEANISIRDKKDRGPGDYNLYVPSDSNKNDGMTTLNK